MANDLPIDPAAGSETDQGLAKVKNTMSSITKQRVKLNIKVLGVQLGADQQGKEQGQQSGQSGEKQTFREQFKAPEMSIVSKLMSKVSKISPCFIYDFAPWWLDFEVNPRTQ